MEEKKIRTGMWMREATPDKPISFNSEVLKEDVIFKKGKVIKMYTNKFASEGPNRPGFQLIEEEPAKKNKEGQGYTKKFEDIPF